MGVNRFNRKFTQCARSLSRDPETIKVKGKASSLDIAPLTILNSGTFTTAEVAADWQ